MVRDESKRPGGVDRFLRAVMEVLQCVRIAIDIIRLLRTGFV